MKRAISILLTLAIFATFFSGITVNVSAASNEWQVYNTYGYYDGRTDYHVVYFFKERIQRILWWEYRYISRMKVVTYTTTLSTNNKAVVKQRTYTFPQNNYVWVDTCVKYIEKYGSNDLCATYKTVLEDQEIFRFFCIAEQTGISTIGRDYLDMFGKFVGKKVEGCITDAVEEALKISLPDYLNEYSGV